MKRVPYLLLAASLLVSCIGGARNASGEREEVYSPEFATGFSIYSAGEHSSIIEVRNPWQGAENVSFEIFVSRGGETAPEGFVGESVAAPLGRVVCLSSSHIAFIDALGETGSIVGVSGGRFVSNPQVRQSYDRGAVRDVGFDSNLNYELLASLRPDLVLIYGVAGENSSVSGKLRELGIKVMYIGDYLETHPLGKAEWLVAFGELFDKRESARSQVEGIHARYDSLKQEASALPHHPTVMLNAPYRDVWFVPGDRSYIVNLIEDAGGIYTLAGEDNSVSRPISGEAAYVALSRSDVWINPNQATTLDELREQNPKFTDVPAVRSGRVYNSTKRRTESGGSDFWESGALRADRVLEDIIICLHPDWRGGGQQTYYFEKLR